MTNQTAHAISNAMAEALTRFYAKFPEINGLALDTIRHFASETFEKACTAEKVADPRFASQAPDYAYSILVREALTTAKALR